MARIARGARASAFGVANRSRCASSPRSRPQVDHVDVAELLQRLRGERRTRATGAVHDDLALAVGHERLEARLEIVARRQKVTRDVSFLPLVGRAYVDEERRRVRVEALVGVDRGDLLDLLADAGQKLLYVGTFKYSGGETAGNSALVPATVLTQASPDLFPGTVSP